MPVLGSLWKDWRPEPIRVYSTKDLAWDGLTLRLGGKRGRWLASVTPDPDWPKMYRVRTDGRPLSDMVNLTRAKDAARCLALADLKHQETRAEAPRIRYFEGAATSVHAST
jgi:hypothetical protein